MEEEFIAHQRPAWATAIILFIVASAGFIFIGPLIGFIFATPFIEGSILDFLGAMRHAVDHPEIKIPLLIIQACGTFFGLAVVPALYWWIYEKRNPLHLLKSNGTPLVIFMLTAVIVISFLPIDSVFINWNSNVKFPEFMGGFDKWARDTEKMNEMLVTLFTKFDSFGQFLFAFFVISTLAGFSEELLFRGLIQPVLKTATGNIHVAIWLTAILFSAFHLEFFGFVPRLLLGALFGYLYYWSGNLVLSMVGHMVNNGLAVIGLYLNQKQKLAFDVDSTDAFPVSGIIGGVLIFSASMYFFHRFYKTTTTTSA